MTTPDQIDRDAADKWAHAEDTRDAMIQAFAAHRQAALLEGVRIGLAAAADELSMQSCCCSFDVMALDPATVLARHGDA